MLVLKPNCEHCDRDLPPESPMAMICTFECTFCAPCVESTLDGICPNCTGNFVPRPIRPASMLEAFPPQSERHHQPVDLDAHRVRVAEVRAARAATDES